MANIQSRRIITTTGEARHNRQITGAQDYAVKKIHICGPIFALSLTRSDRKPTRLTCLLNKSCRQGHHPQTWLSTKQRAEARSTPSVAHTNRRLWGHPRGLPHSPSHFWWEASWGVAQANPWHNSPPLTSHLRETFEHVCRSGAPLKRLTRHTADWYSVLQAPPAPARA